jgi:hypothetical protein
MVRVGAARRESHGTLAEPSRLALDAEQTDAVVNDQVRAGVLTEWKEHPVARTVQREHHRQSGLIADGLRVSHQRIVAQAPDGATAETVSTASPTMFLMPE